MSLFVFVLVLAAVTGGYSFVLRHFGMKGLACRRHFSARTVFEGEEAALVEVVSNDRPLLVPWLRMESRVSPYVRFGRQDNLDVAGDMYHRSLFMLMPFQRITRRHRVRFLRRGVYDVGNATLTVGDVLGQMQYAVEQQMRAPIIVYPRLLDEDTLPEPLTRLVGEMTVARQLQQDPFLVRGIRSYQMGDPVRDIHWPATARMGEAQVRVHDYTCQARLLVLLNSQTREDQWDDLMDYEQDVIEQEIRLAATLCMKLLRAGLTAGFACNMPMDEPQSRESVCLPPLGGVEQQERLLEAFARLRIRRTRSFNTFLDELPAQIDVDGMDLVVLSPYDSAELRARLAMLATHGASTRLVVLDPKEVTPRAD